MVDEPLGGDLPELADALRDAGVPVRLRRGLPPTLDRIIYALQVSMPNLADRPTRRLATRIIYLVEQTLVLEDIMEDVALCVRLHRAGVGMPSADTWPEGPAAERVIDRWRFERAGVATATAYERIAKGTALHHWLGLPIRRPNGANPVPK